MKFSKVLFISRSATLEAIRVHRTAQKMKFYIKDFFSKCDQIRRKLWIWSHLLKKSLIANFISLCSETIEFCFADTYSDPFQTPSMKRVAKIVNGFLPFPQHPPSQMFDRVLNTPLFGAYISLD